jgi:hypothetical protein
MKIKKISAGNYQYGDYYIYKWNPEIANCRVLWCVSLDGVGMEDFKTLRRAKKYIEQDKK